MTPEQGEARMTTVEALVQGYYGRSDLLQRIEARLRTVGVDPQKPGFRDLHPFDQLHGLGILATEEHAARAGVRAGMQVLDLGSGLGGSSRYLAAVCGCRVSAIDLTPEFVELARVLTARCGLADSIDYRQASALALPFEDASFDHVWCHNVTMNIADRATLAREVARVLRRQGRFSCVETAQGPGGPPVFPLPWAKDPSASCLATPEAMCAAVEQAGLRIVEQINFAAEVVKRGEPPHQANDVVMGDDFEQRRANVMTGLQEQRLVDQLIIAEKP
jgi:ubiquinone/menaquinone biosynthesis C-methylase UbiE